MDKRYPGGSRSRVNKAGDAIRNGLATAEDMAVIEEWRSAHRGVLNTFQAILRNRTKAKSKEVVVAQRHKRKNTIFDKLNRISGMELSRMDDIAGCRLIFKNIKDLESFRSKFHKARFAHKLRNHPDKYNYILNPKKTGYRGVHDVYEYNVNSESGKNLKGLYIEIQYRTRVQHAWATAVEVIGFITESQPKFEKGDDRYGIAMALASEILARAYENNTSTYATLSNTELLKKFLEIESEINLIKTLKGVTAAKSNISEKKNTILHFSDNGKLDVYSFKDATEALKYLFDLEKRFPDNDIVLVRADKSDDIRFAFKNYFGDSSEFIRLIEAGCAKISGKQRVF